MIKEYGKRSLQSTSMNKLIFLTISILISIAALSEEPSISNNDVYPFSDPQKEELFYSLIFELRCPKCQSSNLSGSNSPISNDLKREVYELVNEGKSAQQIEAHLIERYGNFIVYNPPIEPATLVLWYGPLFLLLLSLVIIFYIRRKK